MDTKVQVGSLTSTEQAVMVTIGTISAFFVGLAMILTPFKTIIDDEPLITLPAPMVIKNVTFGKMLSSDDIYSSFMVKGLGTQIVSFAEINYAYFADGSASTANKNVFVTMEHPHDSTIITLQTDQGLKTLCLPDKSADAQGQNPENVIKNYSYYFDYLGNPYKDSRLTTSFGINCPAIASRSFHPYSIDGQFSAVKKGAPYHLQLNRDSNIVALVVDDKISVNPNAPLPIPSSVSPLEVLAYDYTTNETYTHAQGIIDVGYSDGLQTFLPPINFKSLCVPAMTVDVSDGAERFFYGSNGYPYTDVFLTQRVPCDFPVPTCTDSDPQQDVYLQGKTSGTDRYGNAYESKDVCYGVNSQGIGTQVGQFYCMNATSGSGQWSAQMVYDCANGCQASTGTCRQASSCICIKGTEPCCLTNSGGGE